MCTEACEQGHERNYTIVVDPTDIGVQCLGQSDCKPGDGTCTVSASTIVGSTLGSLAFVAFAIAIACSCFKCGGGELECCKSFTRGQQPSAAGGRRRRAPRPTSSNPGRRRASTASNQERRRVTALSRAKRTQDRNQNNVAAVNSRVTRTHVNAVYEERVGTTASAGVVFEEIFDTSFPAARQRSDGSSEIPNEMYDDGEVPGALDHAASSSTSLSMYEAPSREQSEMYDGGEVPGALDHSGGAIAAAAAEANYTSIDGSDSDAEANYTSIDGSDSDISL